jgi:hypothetical protein
MPFRSIEWDLDAERITLQLNNGAIHTRDAPPSVGRRAPNVRGVRLDLRAGIATLRLPDGDDAEVELAAPDRSRLGHRRVVYLDQNKWSLVAAWRHGHRRVDDPNEAEAAEALGQLVSDRCIIVPVAAAHLLETSHDRGARRIPIATTMLELSRGWQMRHPANVGRFELRAAVAGTELPAATDIFTLAPNATFAQPNPPRAIFPGPFGAVMANLVAATGTYDAMIDDKPIPDEGGDAVCGSWARAQDELVEMLRNDGASREEVRRCGPGSAPPGARTTRNGESSRRARPQCVQRVATRSETRPYSAAAPRARVARPLRPPAKPGALVGERSRRHLQPMRSRGLR